MEDGGIVHLAVKFGGTLKSQKSLKFASSGDEGLRHIKCQEFCLPGGNQKDSIILFRQMNDFQHLGGCNNNGCLREMSCVSRNDIRTFL